MLAMLVDNLIIVGVKGECRLITGINNYLYNNNNGQEGV